MSMLLDPFPNTELLVQAVIRKSGKRSYSSLPKQKTAELIPLTIVTRFGGVPPVPQRLDRAALQIEAWGNKKSEAHDLARDTRLELLGMQGVVFNMSDGWPVDAFVTGVDQDLGITFSPDPVTGKDRYLFGMSIFAHSL